MMGALEEAKYKAPWPDATPEEDLAYSQNVELANTEFEADVRNASPPWVHPYIDADRATLLSTKKPWNIHGFYTPEGTDYSDPDDEYAQAIIERYGKVLQDADAALEEDTVYAVNPLRANPSLWGHEFTHRQHSKEDVEYWAQSEEKAVRKMQGFYASTPDQWARAVNLWRDYIMRRRDAPNSMSLVEAENHLKDTLKTAESNYIDKEVEHYESKGDKPKERPWRIDTLSADARERLERRQRSWNVEDSILYKKAKAYEAAQQEKYEEMRQALEDLEKALEERRKVKVIPD